MPPTRDLDVVSRTRDFGDSTGLPAEGEDSMRSIAAMGLIWLAAAGCGCDSESAGDRACQKLEAKLAQCGLVARGDCDPSERCPAECFANAECNEFTGGTPGGALLACIAACSGAGPD